jgi:hypothetical protein
MEPCTDNKAGVPDAAAVVAAAVAEALKVVAAMVAAMDVVAEHQPVADSLQQQARRNKFTTRTGMWTRTKMRPI